MKKTRFIALALVVAIALMGAGYAAWTDKLYVENTVNTGRLDVDFTKVEKIGTDPCWVTVTSKIVPDGDPETCGDKNTGNPVTNNDKLQLTVENAWPGAVVQRRITVTNLGTIPVKINADYFKTKPKDFPNQAQMVASLDELDDEVDVEIVPIDEGGIMMTSGGSNYIQIDQNGTKSFDIKLTFKSSADNATQCKKYTYNFELPFEQGDCKTGGGGYH